VANTIAYCDTAAFRAVKSSMEQALGLSLAEELNKGTDTPNPKILD
jgi:hypothetical protein